MAEQYDVSIIIACYNEADYLQDHVKLVLQAMDTTIYKYEIIFVDDASNDSTREIIGRLCAGRNNMSYIFHSVNQGRGSAVKDGILRARGKVAGFIDIDLETHCRYIPALVQAIIDGADVACAWRLYKTRIFSFDRWFLNRGYNLLVRYFLGLNFRDTETGCKFFKRSAILSVLAETTDNHWFWDTEIIGRAYLHGLKIVEMPTLYIRKSGKRSSVKIPQDIIYYLKKLLWFKKVLSSALQGSAAQQKQYWQNRSEGFEKYYFHSGKSIIRRFIRGFLDKRTSHIISLLGETRGQRVLDLGCGSGRLLAAVAQGAAWVTGVDYSPKMLEAARRRLGEEEIKNCDLILADAAAVPLESGSYDIVICAGLLDYLPDMGMALQEIRRLLKKSGRAVITIPSKNTPFFLFRHAFGGYLRRFFFGLPPVLNARTKKQMLKLLDQHGLTEEYSKRIYATMWIFVARPE